MRKVIPILLLALLSTFVRAEETIWTSDLAAAKAKAIKEGKTLLIVFTGSDWCGACSQFEKEILSKPEVINEIVKKYVPVVIDFPRKAELLPALKKQNEDLAKLVGLTAVPTMGLMDPEGRFYATDRGFDMTMTPKIFLKKLEGFEAVKVQRDECFAEAAKAPTPAEKAQILHNAMMTMRASGLFDSWTLYGYESVIDEIVKGDPDNKNNLRIGWDYTLMVMKSRELLVAEKHAAAIVPLDEFIKKYAANKEWAQKALYAKAQILALAHDARGCIMTLAEVIEADPNSELGKEASKVLEQIAKEQEEDRKGQPQK